MHFQNQKMQKFFPVPKEMFSLGLSAGEITVYAYLMYCEDRKTFQCHPSYNAIGKADAEGKLEICRTLHEDGTTGDTKTSSGMRTIKLPQSAADMLRARKQTAISEWIFPNPLKPEKAVSGNAAYSRLKKILKECNLPSIRFHDLRHTFATMALENGIDIKTLAEILGHNTVATALNTYTHSTAKMQESAARRIDRVIGRVSDEAEQNNRHYHRCFECHRACVRAVQGEKEKTWYRICEAAFSELLAGEIYTASGWQTSEL